MQRVKCNVVARRRRNHFFRVDGNEAVPCFSVKRFTPDFASSATTVVRVNCVLVALTGGPPRRSRADKRKTLDADKRKTCGRGLPPRGRDFGSIQIAFSPRATPRRFEKRYLRTFGKEGGEGGWYMTFKTLAKRSFWRENYPTMSSVPYRHSVPYVPDEQVHYYCTFLYNTR